MLRFVERLISPNIQSYESALESYRGDNDFIRTASYRLPRHPRRGYVPRNGWSLGCVNTREGARLPLETY